MPNLGNMSASNQSPVLRLTVEAIVEKKKQEGLDLTEEQQESLYTYIKQRLPARIYERIIMKGAYFEPIFADFFAKLEEDS